MSTAAVERNMKFEEKTEQISFFDRLTKWFSFSPEYTAGVLLMNGSYSRPNTQR